MYDILTLNAISDKIYNVFDESYKVSADAEAPDAILVRSFNMQDYEIGDNLLAVARAGAGVNNIPVSRMTEEGVVVFNTPGANANAVKELVVLALLLTCRGVIGGVNWANSLKGSGAEVPKLVEKGKKNFAGCEIFGKTIGVIGLGAIGVKVALCLKGLGMKVIGYDPYLSDDAKKTLEAGDVVIASLDDIYANSDFITLHVPLVDSTRGMINENTIAKMKDGVRIMNFSRGELCSVPAIKEGIAAKKIKAYAVDFPTEETLGADGIIAIPHLGASTEEAEDNCAEMAAAQLKDYLENGNIVNSVNFPKISVPRQSKYRITVTYNSGKEVPEQLKSLAEEFGLSLSYAERGTLGYAIMDTDDEKFNSIGEEDDFIDRLSDEVPEIFSVRLL